MSRQNDIDLIASIAKHTQGVFIVEEFHDELCEHFQIEAIRAMAPDRYEDDA